MNKILISFVALIFTAIICNVGACNSLRQAGKLSSTSIPYYLLTAIPGQIEKNDFSNGETSVIYKFEKRLQPHGLTNIDDKILIASYESYGEVIPKMYMINMDGDLISELGYGSNPKYIDKWGKVLFFDRSSAERGLSIYSAEIKKNKLFGKKEIFRASYASGREIFYNSKLNLAYIQDDEVTFLKIEKDGSVSKSYLENCILSETRAFGNQLICLNRNGGYFIADANGKKVSDLPAEIGIPRIYVPELDAILTVKTRLDPEKGEVDSVWIYYLENGQLSPLKNPLSIWPDSSLMLKKPESSREVAPDVTN